MKESGKVAASASGAIGLSSIASFVGLCCIGPWAVSFLGISGAIAMARWQPYRPYLLGVASVLLLWAFWRVYGPQKPCPDGTCPTRRSLWLQGFLWLAVLMIGLAFFADDLQWILVDPTPEGLRHVQ